MCARRVLPHLVPLQQVQAAVAIADPARRTEAARQVEATTEAAVLRQEVPRQAQAAAPVVAIAAVAVAQVQAVAIARAADVVPEAATAVQVAAVQAAEEDNFQAMKII